MKKRLVLVLIMVMLSLTACAKVEKANKTDASMFVEVEQTTIWKVVYHKDTKVMYVVSCGGYNSGDFTLLVNADGTPMLWNE